MFLGNTFVFGAYVTVVGTCLGVPEDGIYYFQLLFLGVSNTSLMGLMSPMTIGKNSFLISKTPLGLPHLLPPLHVTYVPSLVFMLFDSTLLALSHPKPIITPLVRRFYNLSLTTSHYKYARLPTFSDMEYY